MASQASKICIMLKLYLRCFECSLYHSMLISYPETKEASEPDSERADLVVNWYPTEIRQSILFPLLDVRPVNRPTQEVRDERKAS